MQTVTLKSGQRDSLWHLYTGQIITDHCKTGHRWQYFRSIRIEETAADRLVLAVTGNHDQLLKPDENADCTPYDTFQNYLFQRAEQMGIQINLDPSGAYSARFGQIDIIGLQCVAPGRKFGLSSGNLLIACYRNSLDLAKEYDIHSIAFPAISTGRFCFPKQKATHMAIDAIRQWRKENPGYEMMVMLSCIDYRIFDMACEELEQTTV